MVSALKSSAPCPRLQKLGRVAEHHEVWLACEIHPREQSSLCRACPSGNPSRQANSSSATLWCFRPEAGLMPWRHRGSISISADDSRPGWIISHRVSPLQLNGQSPLVDASCHGNSLVPFTSINDFMHAVSYGLFQAKPAEIPTSPSRSPRGPPGLPHALCAWRPRGPRRNPGPPRRAAW